MSTKLGVVLADFTTQLASAMAIGATSATLQSATDDDGVALPAGVYFFAIDGNNSQKEHIVCTLSGTSLTGISSVNRQGVQASGCVRSHRVGSTVTLTDFAHLRYINDLVSGATTFNASVPLGYDGTASITTNNQFATKAYVDGVAVAGAPDATTTAKGIVEIQTQAEFEAGTTSGGTSAPLVHPANVGARFFAGYAADAGANDTYAITLSPVPSAYQIGAMIAFKANTANTGACTLNVNTLGAKSLKVNGLDPRDNYIKASSIVLVAYDGTNMEILSVSGQPQISQDGSEIYAADAGANDTYAITLAPVPAAYVTGMVVRFKANTVNTGAATINVNSLGAKSILRPNGSALSDGDIAASQQVQLIYDGTNFIMISPIANNVTFKVGSTSKNLADASTTQTIAHGLGRIPRFVEIVALGLSSSTLPMQATTFYDGTTQVSLALHEDTGPSYTVSAGFELSDNAANASQIGVVTFDATNISIAWTKGGSPTGTFQMMWKAAA